MLLCAFMEVLARGGAQAPPSHLTVGGAVAELKVSDRLSSSGEKLPVHHFYFYIFTSARLFQD